MTTINRPALGEEYLLGALYDARKDCFLSTAPFADPGDACRVEWHEGKNVMLCDSADYGAKLKTLNLPAPLAASCLAGWLPLRGSAEFLQPSEPRKENEVFYALSISRSTITQELCLDQDEIRESIESVALGRESSATQLQPLGLFPTNRSETTFRGGFKKPYESWKSLNESSWI